jgi:hypothetical protein
VIVTSCDSWKGPVTSSSEHSNYHSDSIKEQNFFDQLTIYQLLKSGLIHEASDTAYVPQRTSEWIEDYANQILEF